MTAKSIHLFETSWEVCNKVGGIYEVVASKARLSEQAFQGGYFLLGPDLGRNTGFVETDEDCWKSLRAPLEAKGLKCRFGRWEIPGRPKVILVDFKGRHDANQLLHKLWERYGVDSLSGGWDYMEPVLFSYTCGEVCAVIHQTLAATDKGHGIAHFHEWMCGAGILALKEIAPFMGTIFTTHATVLGRSMAGNGMDIYSRMSEISPDQEADRYNVTAKHSMERVSAREADVFTTVSGITAEEARYFLGRKPDYVTVNGLDIASIADFSVHREAPEENRAKLLAPIGLMLGHAVDPKTRIFAISGRYEFRNKGVDLFLEALSRLRHDLQNSSDKVLVLLLMMGGHSGVNADAVEGKIPGCITPFHVYDPEHDPILCACKKLGLDNKPEDNVQTVFVPALLDGKDGFFNMPYFDVLSGCDLGVFPSWYEPWGYTPHESAAYAVPTATTDLSGFGLWVRDRESRFGNRKGVELVLRRKNENAGVELAEILHRYAVCNTEELQESRKAARAVASDASWDAFFPLYQKAYLLADEKAHARRHASKDRTDATVGRVLDARPSPLPFFRPLNAVPDIPEELGRLRELAYNLWWCWRSDAVALFQSLDSELWDACGHNPIVLLDKVEPERLRYMAADASYLHRYHMVMDALDAYMEELPREGRSTWERPIAYFSTEFGLHECLPLYSGGLGVLSGDHLKSASDENLPLVGVGLFYGNGYFQQHLDRNGTQIAQYPENNPSELPIRPVLDDKGEQAAFAMPLGDRTIFVRIWKIQVGRVPLFLMDTDLPANGSEDRIITARLYEADRDIRLRQEILLGMGGVRMLEALGIRPSVWHMNEGHSAFLTLERFRRLHRNGLSLQEAARALASSCVFTTHTPVDAGNERFSAELMSRYFRPYAEEMSLSWQEFLNIGRMDGGNPDLFDMTVLALRMSSAANGVSAMHGAVSRRMWKNLRKSVSEEEQPIGHITNGVHLQSYVGLAFEAVLEHHVGPNWAALRPEDPAWNKVTSIPDNQFQASRVAQKQILTSALLKRLPSCEPYASMTPEKRRQWLSAIRTDSLIIGFARRFAPYKRATLLFADPDRLARILNDPAHPCVIIMSGKAHPADSMGIDLIREVVKWTLDPRFFGKIFFLENYNLEISRLLSRGCDVWLNTPRRPYEASGTSGEKVPVNGGINLSISDGWWVEGANGRNGWTIGRQATPLSPLIGQNDYEDAESLYRILENELIPMYFQRDEDGLPGLWLRMAKESLRSLTAQYGCRRMVRDYDTQIYEPAAERGMVMEKNDWALCRKLCAWAESVPGRFNSSSIQSIQISGPDGESILRSRPFHVRLTVSPGDMRKEEILAQLVIGPSEPWSGASQEQRATGQWSFLGKPEVINLDCTGEEDGLLVYEASYELHANGRHSYGVRVLPITEGLDDPLSTGLVHWA